MLNKVALSVQANMKTDLREIYGAPTRAAAEAAIDVFADKDFPAEHWDHLRTSNPIEERIRDGASSNRANKGSPVGNARVIAIFLLCFNYPNYDWVTSGSRNGFSTLTPSII